MAKRSETYLLRLTPEEKASLEGRCEAQEISLAQALRVGAHEHLTRLEHTKANPLVAELYSLTARIDDQLKRGGS